jgi:hypothetical protein
MNGKCIFVISLVTLFVVFGARASSAATFGEPQMVMYTASRTASHTGSWLQIGFDVNATVECSSTWTCSGDGFQPPSQNYSLTVHPNQATLTVDYTIIRPGGSDITGTETVNLTAISAYVLSDSPDIHIPVSLGEITITLHSHMIVKNPHVSPSGGAYPYTLGWSYWGEPISMNVSSTSSSVVLTMDTYYQLYLSSVTVSILGFSKASESSTSSSSVLGTPNPISFAIPTIAEFSTSLIVPFAMIATLLAAVTLNRKHAKHYD